MEADPQLIWMHVDAAASALGISVRTMYRRVQRGEYLTEKRNGRLFVGVPLSEDVSESLAEMAEEHEAGPVSDYVLNAGGPAGVFVVARHDAEQQRFLKYLKLGDGPYYFLLQPFHLCHLEMVGTIEAVLNGRQPLMLEKIPIIL